MTHPFLSRVLAGKQIKYEDGYLFLMGVPSYLFALNTLVVMQKALEVEFGQKGPSIMFNHLAYQTTMAARMMKNRFGFKLEDAMRNHMGHADMIGAGKIEFVRMDIKNCDFILRAQSTFAKEYLKTFGIQKNPVCWLFKGGITNLVNEYLDRDDVVCIETSCIAQGKQYCEFVAKPRKNFNLKDPNIKKQLPIKLKFDFNKVAEKYLMGIPKRN